MRILRLVSRWSQIFKSMESIFRFCGPLYTKKPYNAFDEQIATIGAICRVEGESSLYILTACGDLGKKIPDDAQVEGIRIKKEIFTIPQGWERKDCVKVAEEVMLCRDHRKGVDAALIKILQCEEPIGSKGNDSTKSSDLDIFPGSVDQFVGKCLELLSAISNAQHGKVVSFGDMHHRERFYAKAIVVEQLNKGVSFATAQERGALIVTPSNCADDPSPSGRSVVGMIVEPELKVEQGLRNVAIAYPVGHTLQVMSTKFFEGRQIVFAKEYMVFSAPAKVKTQRESHTPSLMPTATSCRETTEYGVRPEGMVQASIRPMCQETTSPVTKEGVQPIPLSHIGKNKRRYAEIQVGPSGGNYRVTSLGVELRIPPGAVDRDTTLTLVIPDRDDRRKDLPWKWRALSSHIRIEPEGLTYKRPIQLLMDHSMQALSGENRNSNKAILIHKERSNGPWNLITCNRDEYTTELSKEKGLDICPDKEAYIASSYISVNMKSNCDYCLVEADDSQGLKQQVRRVAVLAYADYTETGELNLRVYAAHGVNERRSAVGQMESTQLGGNLVDQSTLFINPEDNRPVDVAVSCSFVGLSEENRSITIPLNDIQQEWGPRPDAAPHVSFVFNTPVGSAPAQVQLKVNTSHGSWRSIEINRSRSIAQVMQRNDRQVSTVLDIEQEQVSYSPWDPHLTHKVAALLSCLDEASIQRIAGRLGLPDAIPTRDLAERVIRDCDYDPLLGFLETCDVNLSEAEKDLLLRAYQL